MESLLPDGVRLTPVSTAPAPLDSLQHPARRKTSLPALFLHRKLSHTPAADCPPAVPASHHSNGGVGNALKRIKKVVFS